MLVSDYLVQLFPDFAAEIKHREQHHLLLLMELVSCGAGRVTEFHKDHTRCGPLWIRHYPSEDCRCSYVVKCFSAVKSGDRTKQVSVVPHSKAAYPSQCTDIQTAAKPI